MADTTNDPSLRPFPGSEWVDNTHSDLQEDIRLTVVWLDGRFGDGSVTGETAVCTAMIGVEARMDKDGGVSAKGRGRASFDLPNMERNLRVVVDNFRHDLLPGISRYDDERELKIGTHWRMYRTLRSMFDFDAGVKARYPPKPFARLLYAHERRYGEWTADLEQSGFWTVDDHLGELTALTFTRSLGSMFLARSVTAAKFSEKSEGLESEQTLGFGVQFTGGRRQIDLSGSVFAHGNDIVSYRVRLGWHARWLRDWCTFYIIPEVEFPVDEDLEPHPAARIGVETVYW